MAGYSWVRYTPSDRSPWNLRRVVHLHRRAGFAATWSEIQRDLADGPEKSVERLLVGKGRSTGVAENFEHMAKVLTHWLSLPANAVLGDKITALPLFKATSEGDRRKPPEYR